MRYNSLVASAVARPVRHILIARAAEQYVSRTNVNHAGMRFASSIEDAECGGFGQGIWA
jgi:hypothetical protein